MSMSNDKFWLFESLCNDTPFWDSDLSWNTENPSLTPCFVDTVLTWIPVVFLWATAPYTLWDYLRSTRPPIAWSWLNRVKHLLSFIYAVVGVAHAIHLILLLKDDITKAHLMALWLKASAVALLFLFLTFQRRNGFVNSGAVWFYLSLQVTSTVIEIAAEHSWNTKNSTNLIYNYIELGFAVCLFILASFPEKITNLQELLGSPSLYGQSGKSETIKDDELSREASPQNSSQIVCPKETASFPSKLTFWWFNSLSYLGYHRPLVVDDLWEVRLRDRCTELFHQFNTYWRHPVFGKEAQKSNNNLKNYKTPRASLMSILGQNFWFYFLLPSVLRLFTELLQLANPVVLKFMISFTESTTEPFWHGIFYSLVFVLTNMLQSISSAYHEHRMAVLGMRIRSCLLAAIYRKSLILASSARKCYSTGEIVNLMAVDSQRFTELLPWLCYLWTAPTMIAIGFYLLWQELGISILGGLTVMIAIIPINGVVVHQVKKLQTRQMTHKDSRLKAINEMLSGIKVLKLYAWEEAFLARIEAIRGLELRLIRNAGFLSTVFVGMIFSSPFLVSCSTFALYILIDSNNQLDAEKAFVSIALFNLLRVPLNMLPNLLTSLILAMVSMKRITRFLNSDETINYVTRQTCSTEAITVCKATFSWDSQAQSNSTKPLVILDNLNVTIPKGQLVAVVGSVGSGKSSFLHSLLGEMQKQSGSVNISGDLKMAYVPQQAWIQNCTVRNNILFGSEYIEKKYDEVVEACALKTDFQMLAGGDQTEIGEKGINLSGGQKQRVSIARACYSEADLFLFDDPLSAVDSHVGKHIFDQVLSNESGMLRDKTRLLVTNALYMLPYVDQIILLRSGTVEAVGSYPHLMSQSSYFAELITNYLLSSQEEDIDESENVQIELPQDLNHESVKFALLRTISQSSVKKQKTKRGLSVEEKVTSKSKGKLVEMEGVEVGNINWRVYRRFAAAISMPWFVTILVNFFLAAALNTGSNFWLSTWTKSKSNNDRFYLFLYFIIGMSQTIFVALGWVSITMGTLRASTNLHSKLMHSVTHAPMYFFDTTPLGRIVNRLSKDIDTIDNNIQRYFRTLLNSTLKVLATLFIISFYTPLFLVFLVAFIILYYFIQRFYMSSSRQLKRLESVTRSPILTHFSETIHGVSTINAYQAAQRFIAESDRRVDQNQKCFYPNAVATCWLQIRLQFLSNCLIFFASLFAALSRIGIGGGLSGSETGLSLSYALNVTLSLNYCVRVFTEIENNIVSVERIHEYTDVPPEAAWSCKEDMKVSKQWPQGGMIELANYATRYRPGLDLVLKSLDLHIDQGEKVGIVGRTGAGKSSLTLALFRLIEPAHGRITIDGVDITKLGLHQLRSRLTIIPQDPVLFCGTIRFNLDPFNQYTDEQLWTVLEDAHLKPFVLTLEEGLEYMVTESGENLSVGQRQLICLARALLRRTQVLVLDEATAAVDLETDSLIQSTIRSKFSHCTVLTIAHRLNTILDSDRVLVFDAGKIAEFDTPQTLLANPESIFHSLAKDAGIVS